MRFLLIFLIGTVFFIFTPFSAQAKVLPQAKKAGKVTTSGAKVATNSITVSPRLRADRAALIITFGNLQNANSVSYIVTYQQNGQQEGAGGSVNISEGNTVTREVFFGTCSSGICRPHRNISNMKLEITAQLKSGKTLIKRYKIKV